MTRLLRAVGKLWIAAAFAVILIGYGSIWFFKGFSALLEVLSPWNVVNLIAVALTFAPGIVLLKLADRIERNRRSADSAS